jgi:hypothetical protein
MIDYIDLVGSIGDGPRYNRPGIRKEIIGY